MCNHLYVFFGEMSILIFYSFFDWVVFVLFLILTCMSCLYILDITPLSVALYSSMLFYHSEGCLFILLQSPFTQVQLDYFCFHFYYSRRQIKKILLQFLSKLMFSFKTFMVSGPIFWSLIHSEFIFVCGVRKCSNLIILHVVVHFSQHHLLKRLSFLHCVFLHPLS